MSDSRPDPAAYRRTTITLIVIGLVFSAISVITNPFGVPSIIGGGLGAWSMYRTGKFNGPSRRTLWWLALVAVILGAFSLLGTGLGLLVLPQS